MYRKNKFKEQDEDLERKNIEKFNSLNYIFRDIFYILSPLIIVIGLILLIIKCKKITHSFRKERQSKFNNINYNKNNLSCDFSLSYKNSFKNFQMKNIPIKQNSNRYINLTDMETTEISLDEKSKMIQEI